MRQSFLEAPIIEREEQVDFEICKRGWKKAPRLSGPMANAFRGYITGTEQKPKTSPLEEDDPKLFKEDVEILRFRKSYVRYAGIFKHHFAASVPYVYQQDCSLGAALLAYLLDLSTARKGLPVTLWTLGNSNGVLSRTIADLGNGYIHTLNNCETLGAEADFNSLRPSGAYFFSGPFFDIETKGLSVLPAGLPQKFAVIHENLSFQMYQSNRKEQVAYIAQFLETDGVFTAIEKCIIPDHLAEYERRERVKDAFKARYFSQDEIVSKHGDVLSLMELGMVSVAQLIRDVATTFPHVALIWNSSNFYTIVASRNPENVRRFCSFFMPPVIAPDYVHCDVPCKMEGLNGINLVFREPDATSSRK